MLEIEGRRVFIRTSNPVYREYYRVVERLRTGNSEKESKPSFILLSNAENKAPLLDSLSCKALKSFHEATGQARQFMPRFLNHQLSNSMALLLLPIRR